VIICSGRTHKTAVNMHMAHGSAYMDASTSIAMFKPMHIFENKKYHVSSMQTELLICMYNCIPFLKYSINTFMLHTWHVHDE